MAQRSKCLLGVGRNISEKSGGIDRGILWRFNYDLFHFKLEKKKTGFISEMKTLLLLFNTKNGFVFFPVFCANQLVTNASLGRGGEKKKRKKKSLLDSLFWDRKMKTGKSGRKRYLFNESPPSLPFLSISSWVQISDNKRNSKYFMFSKEKRDREGKVEKRAVRTNHGWSRTRKKKRKSQRLRNKRGRLQKSLKSVPEIEWDDDLIFFLNFSIFSLP